MAGVDTLGSREGVIFTRNRVTGRKGCYTGSTVSPEQVFRSCFQLTVSKFKSPGPTVVFKKEQAS